MCSLKARFLIIFFIFQFFNISVMARTVVTQTPVYPHYNSYYNNYNNIARTNSLRNSYYNPRHRLYRNHSNYAYKPYYNKSFSDLSALEKYSLNKTYSRESDLQRLQRLEMQAFGAVQSGDITTRYDNVRNAILSRPKQNYKTSLLRNIGNYFSGQMTGYTPSFSNDSFFSDSSFSRCPYPTSYGNRSYSQVSGPLRSGYFINDYGTSSGAGVKILD